MRTAIVAVLVLVVGVPALSGCMADDHASAQGPSPITSVDCVGFAERRTGLTPLQIQRLCMGAPTATGPVDCHIQAVRQLNVTDDQGVLLCHCSDSRAPVTCWLHARQQGRLIDDEIMQLCSPTVAMGLLPTCRYVGY